MDFTNCKLSEQSSDSPVQNKPRIVRPWECSPRKSSRMITNQTPPKSKSVDSGYDTDDICTPKTGRKYLNPRAVDMMEQWYIDNFHHPYPTEEDVQNFAQNGGITTTQVKKWMANKRVRSHNTLSYNNTIHPKRLRRLQKHGLPTGTKQKYTRFPKRLDTTFAAISSHQMIPYRTSYINESMLFPVMFPFV